ncbi:MAG TPA: bifunctional isocitrate dehydrogenase kinase/phosphatase [Acidimicrobiia bacterium]|nr:bifunctional isocitrate dehydrogenase kinase/phosphatase [Acidimicrobiia bacterium]
MTASSSGAAGADLSDSRLAGLGAKAVASAWSELADRHLIVTRRARHRFEARDWAGLAADHVERLDLYARAAADTADRLRHTLEARDHDPMVWAGMKAVYAVLVSTRPDTELAETFFNSVTRKIFTTVGVNPRIEFVDSDVVAPGVTTPVFRTYHSPGSAAALVAQILRDTGLAAAWRSLEEDAALAGDRIADRLATVGGLRNIDSADVVVPLFFRGSGAAIVARVSSGSQVVPVVLVLAHAADGVRVDAVLLTENDVSILFSFTRSYFFVNVVGPQPLVHFLGTLMPRKRTAELYISLGYVKHGKTELYREIRRHLSVAPDRFVTTRGTPGLVMVVFTLPGFDIVLKVIRDRFGAPKQVTRDRVLNRYRLVFRHDRAGRLVDAQEFEHLTLPRERFDPGLLDYLVEQCSRSVEVDGDTVTIRHTYVERRVTPLDVYLKEARPADAERSIDDYGLAIKDMAASGIFPGDMLMKNFGVTRHGRVVFYDYDELQTLEEVSFRALPDSDDPQDTMSAEPWFPIGPDDVFPEEFRSFLGLQGRLREVFEAKHSDLFDPVTWQRWQQLRAEGKRMEIFAYRDEVRLGNR